MKGKKGRKKKNTEVIKRKEYEEIIY